jgi:hypothetical protein
MKCLFCLATVVSGSRLLETTIAGMPTGDKERTYFDIGAENSFMLQQWD